MSIISLYCSCLGDQICSRTSSESVFTSGYSFFHALNLTCRSPPFFHPSMSLNSNGLQFVSSRHKFSFSHQLASSWSYVLLKLFTKCPAYHKCRWISPSFKAVMESPLRCTTKLLPHIGPAVIYFSGKIPPLAPDAEFYISRTTILRSKAYKTAAIRLK